MEQSEQKTLKNFVSAWVLNDIFGMGLQNLLVTSQPLDDDDDDDDDELFLWYGWPTKGV